MSSAAREQYVMGHNDRERRRLHLQASILQPFTEHLFRRAGITSGMNVLDVGCGVGDVSLLAARLVGRTGTVTSIDFDPAALATLRQRAEDEGFTNITAVESDLHHFRPDRRFDAVVGRHILIHTKDPLEVLKDARNLLCPRGIAAFQEYDFQIAPPTYPPRPVRDEAFAFFTGVFAAGPLHGNMGSKLYHLFLKAGFQHPDCRCEIPVDGGPESPYHEWFAEAVRSVLPRAKQLGLPGAEELDIDGLEARLREETIATEGGFSGPMMFACFARRD